MKKWLLFGGVGFVLAAFFVSQKAIVVSDLPEVSTSDISWPSGPPLILLQGLQENFDKKTTLLNVDTLQEQPFNQDWQFRYVSQNVLYAFKEGRPKDQEGGESLLYLVDLKTLRPLGFQQAGSRRLFDVFPDRGGSLAVIKSNIGESSSVEYCKLSLGDKDAAACHHRITILKGTHRMAWDDNHHFGLHEQSDDHVTVYGPPGEKPLVIKEDEDAKAYRAWQDRFDKSMQAAQPLRAYGKYTVVPGESKTLLKGSALGVVPFENGNVLYVQQDRLLIVDTKKRRKATVLYNPSLVTATIIVGSADKTYRFN